MKNLILRWPSWLGLVCGLFAGWRANGQVAFILTEAGWASGGVVAGGGFSMVAGVPVTRSEPLRGGDFSLVGKVGSPSSVHSHVSAPELSYELTGRGTLLLKFTGIGTVLLETAERFVATPGQTVWTPWVPAAGPSEPGVLGEVPLSASQRFFRLRRP